MLRTHYAVLKEIFVTGVVDSLSPPDFRRDGFYKFCEKARIPDRRLNRGVIDTYFVATNFEKDQMDGNSDSALCRFEFLEILVRLAKAKYIEFGK